MFSDILALSPVADLSFLGLGLRHDNLDWANRGAVVASGSSSFLKPGLTAGVETSTLKEEMNSVYYILKHDRTIERDQNCPETDTITNVSLDGSVQFRALVQQ